MAFLRRFALPPKARFFVFYLCRCEYLLVGRQSVLQHDIILKRALDVNEEQRTSYCIQYHTFQSIHFVQYVSYVNSGQIGMSWGMLLNDFSLLKMRSGEVGIKNKNK